MAAPQIEADLQRQVDEESEVIKLKAESASAALEIADLKEERASLLANAESERRVRPGRRGTCPITRRCVRCHADVAGGVSGLPVICGAAAREGCGAGAAEARGVGQGRGDPGKVRAHRESIRWLGLPTWMGYLCLLGDGVPSLPGTCS